MELAERQSDLLTALNYTKEDLLVGCPVVKDFHVRKKHVLFKNAFKVNKLSNFVFCHIKCNRSGFTRKICQKKFKVNFFINLIKLKLILMSILFWPETQIVEIVDLVDQKNSYIGTASRVMLASGNVAICCR